MCCLLKISYPNKCRSIWRLYSLYTCQLCLCLQASLHPNRIQTEMLHLTLHLSPVSFSGSGCLELPSSNFCWWSIVKTKKIFLLLAISSWFFQYWWFNNKCYNNVDTSSSIGIWCFPFVCLTPVRKLYFTGIWISPSIAELKCMSSLNWRQESPVLSDRTILRGLTASTGRKSKCLH